MRSNCPLRVLGPPIECKQTLDFVLSKCRPGVHIYVDEKVSRLSTHPMPKDVYFGPSEYLCHPDVNCIPHAHQARA